MAGIDSIIQRIADDSKQQCDEIIARAHQQAETIRNDAQNRASKAADEIIENAQKQADIILQRAHSAAQTANARALLAEKVAIIREVLAQASERLSTLSDEQYEKAVLLLAIRYTKKDHGIMRLSPEDAARLPDEFQDKLNNALASKGATLEIQTVQQEQGGFILVYSDIEQNCTFNALLYSMQDELKDQINNQLFV